MRARSDGWSVTVRDFVRPRCVLTARRYGMQPVGIHWISHTVMVTQQHCISRPLARLFDCPAPSAASACVRSIARVPEGPPTLCGGRFREQRRGLPLKSHPCAREGRAPPGDGGSHGRRPSAPHAGTPGTGGPTTTRPAPRRSQSSRFPVRQVAARTRRELAATDPISEDDMDAALF
jgi:hypothetical protein